MKTIILLLGIVAVAFGQAKQEPAKPPATVAEKPAQTEPITPEMRANFWKASLQKHMADENFNASVQPMVKACESVKKMMIQDQATGEPTCVDVPASPAKTK
jgi:hypothetical protein